MSVNSLKVRQLSVRFAAAFALMLAIGSCGGNKNDSDTLRRRASEGTVAARLADTIRVATLYSPSSYFIYRDEPMGYDYNLISQFAEDKGVALKIEVAPTLSAAMEMLDDGKVDVIAYEIPRIAEFRDNIIPCGPESESYQVLVQPRRSGDIEIKDVTDIPGHEVFVEDNSKYLYRLQNLNEELGGGIDIRIVENDTVITDDLFEMVAEGEIPLTVVDNETARINSSYFPTLDMSVDISFHQTSAWGVAPAMKWLGDSIDAWLDTDVARAESSELYKRYFEQARYDGADIPQLDLSDGVISKYDDLFKKYAAEIGWDWRLLAAISLQESRFNPNARSWAGARGLMQIMPKTGRAYGVDVGRLSDPETAIRTSVKIIGDLDKMLQAKIPDDKERIKFILASYNGGIGHVSDAMSLAEKYGYLPATWSNNVERAVLMKSDPQYYNDKAVKYGYMRGRETTDYVKKILGYYDTFRVKVPA